MELIYTLDEIDKAAHKLLEAIEGEVVLFNAPMGAGKTTLIKALCAQLKVEGEVSSPTFSLVNEYVGARPIFHFDLYRIEEVGELYDIGFEDYLIQPGYKFIEWPELAMEFLDGYQEVQIEAIDDHTRRLKIE